MIFYYEFPVGIGSVGRGRGRGVCWGIGDQHRAAFAGDEAFKSDDNDHDHADDGEVFDPGEEIEPTSFPTSATGAVLGRKPSAKSSSSGR